MSALKWEWVGRIDKKGNIRAHLSRRRLPQATWTGWGNTLCGQVVTNSQPASGNAKCKQCLRWSKEPHGSE